MRTIIQVSDLHFGAIAQGSAQALLETILRLNPDLVVVSGDLTMAGRSIEFRQAREFIAQITTPTLVVPGNHDIPAYALADRFITPLRRYRQHITPDIQPTFIDDQLAILGLNTARPWDLSWNWSHGRYSRRQIRRAVRFFQTNHDAPFKCLVGHHPFIVPENLPGFRRVGRAEAMLAVLARHRVDLVLSGHLHQGFWRCHEITIEPAGRKVLVVQASTATSTRRREHANAFNHLVVDGDRLVLTPWEWTGEQPGRGFGPGTSSTFARDAAGWTPVQGPAIEQTVEQSVVATGAGDAGGGEPPDG